MQCIYPEFGAKARASENCSVNRTWLGIPRTSSSTRRLHRRLADLTRGRGSGGGGGGSRGGRGGGVGGSGDAGVGGNAQC